MIKSYRGRGSQSLRGNSLPCYVEVLSGSILKRFYWLLYITWSKLTRQSIFVSLKKLGLICLCPQFKYVSFTYYLSYMSIHYGFITNSHKWIAPSGLESSTGRALSQRSCVRISFQHGFFQVFFRYCLSSVNNLKTIICFCPQIKYVSFTYHLSYNGNL